MLDNASLSLSKASLNNSVSLDGKIAKKRKLGRIATMVLTFRRESYLSAFIEYIDVRYHFFFSEPVFTLLVLTNTQYQYVYSAFEIQN